MNIFLDDVRDPALAGVYMKDVDYFNEKWAVARNYEEFKRLVDLHMRLSEDSVKMVSLDHDLAQEHYADLLRDRNFLSPDDEVTLNYDEYKEKTGLECAKWLISYCKEHNKPLPIIKVHTQNPIGKQNIMRLLKDVKQEQ